MAEAVRTLGPGFNPSGYTFIGGTTGEDFFVRAASAGPDVFCGFGGNDSISTLDEANIFLGGAGQDTVDTNNGTFNGSDNNDIVYSNYDSGTFNGGAGDDYVKNNSGTFDGGDGTDTVFGNVGILISVEQGDV